MNLSASKILLPAVIAAIFTVGPLGFLPVLAASENLIVNPSLETVGANGDPQGWFRGGWGTNTRTFTYPVAGVDGGKAAKVEITSYTNGDAKWYFQEVSVIPGTTYILSESYASNIPSLLGIRFKMTDGSFTYLDIANVPSSSTNWQSAGGSFTAPAGAVSLTVFHVIKQAGDLTTDNFSLTVAPVSSGNLIQNPTFETVGANGDPVGWLRGGYGQNTRGHGRVACDFYTDAELAWRPACPPNTGYVLSTHIDIPTYIDGDAKWYFADVPIGSNKNFRISYDYQAYTYAAQAVVRYFYPNGTYSYSFLSNMPQGVGGMGYSGWVFTEHDFTAPTGATSLTVFFSVRGGKVCRLGCVSPDHGNLSIANVVLKLRDGTELPPRSIDGILPNVSVYSPNSDETVTGTIAVTVNATDNVGVNNILLLVDDNYEKQMGVNSPNVINSFSWDTTKVVDGPHILTIHASDAAGNSVVSAPINVDVANSIPQPTTNLVANPSFETTGANGDPADWLRGGWGTNTRTFTYPSSGMNGGKAAKVEITSYTSGDAKWYFTDVPVVGGQTYNLHSFYKATVPTETVARYQTSTGTQYQFLGTLAPASDWTIAGRLFTVPANATSLTVFHLISQVGTLEIDDFNFFQHGN